MKEMCQLSKCWSTSTFKSYMHNYIFNRALMCVMWKTDEVIKYPIHINIGTCLLPNNQFDGTK